MRSYLSKKITLGGNQDIFNLNLLMILPYQTLKKFDNRPRPRAKQNGLAVGSTPNKGAVPLIYFKFELLNFDDNRFIYKIISLIQQAYIHKCNIIFLIVILTVSMMDMSEDMKFWFYQHYLFQ